MKAFIDRYGLGFFFVFVVVALIGVLLGQIRLVNFFVDLMIVLLISLGGVVLWRTTQGNSSDS